MCHNNFLKSFFVISLLCLIPFNSKAQETNEDFFSAQKCDELGLYLTECAPFKCFMPHPQISGVRISQEITGLDIDGRCVHKQTMSPQEILVCKYYPDSRKYISIRMDQKKSEINSNPEQEYLEAKLMQDIFENECDVLSEEELDSEVNSQPDNSESENSPLNTNSNIQINQ